MLPTITLGLGIIGIGKPWGHLPSEVPAERDALDLLEFAWQLGIRYFDSAPSYGIAEARLGKFLRAMNPAERSKVIIATKFGEHWDATRNEPYVDHSFDALRRSLDTSVETLGRIDFLQLHKTTPIALCSSAVTRAFDYAGQLGISVVGASVSDLESAAMTIAEPRYKCIQLPLNLANRKFSDMVRQAAARDMWIATNRPYAMGAMLYESQPVSHEEAFRYVLGHEFEGVVLTGTKSKQHLQENWTAFHSAAV